jgi:hypothetical protein
MEASVCPFIRNLNLTKRQLLTTEPHRHDSAIVNLYIDLAGGVNGSTITIITRRISQLLLHLKRSLNFLLSE